MRREKIEILIDKNLCLGLNPCFSGICAASFILFGFVQKSYCVLILVLVEYAPRVNMKKFSLSYQKS